MKRSAVSAFVPATLVALTMLFAGPRSATVYAQDGSWAATSSGNWSGAANWSGGIVADGAGNTATFMVDVPAAGITVNIDGARTIGNLEFGDGTPGVPGNWILSGSTLTLQTTAPDVPTITVGTLGDGAAARINATISGTGGFLKDGDGVLILGGANNYTGPTAINTGTLRLGNTQAIAATNSIAVATGATLDFGGISNSLFTNLTIAGHGVGANVGALTNSSTAAAYSAVRNLTLAADASVGGNVGGPGNAPGRLDFSGSGSSVDLAGYMLTKVGASELLWRVQTATAGAGGTLVINGGAVNIESHNNNLPTTTVNNGGTLSTYGNRSQNAGVALNAGSTLAAYNGTGTWTGPITVGGAATLNAGEAAAFPYYSGGTLTISGPMSGTGSITKIGGNTLTLSGDNSGYSGPIQVSQGTLHLGHVAALGSSANAIVNSGATLDFRGFRAPGTYTIAGTGTSGQGALVNTGGSIADYQVNLTLAGNASIGGTGRFDIGWSGGTLDGGGFTLTKTGTNMVAIRGSVVNLPTLNVNEGLLYFEASPNISGTTINVASDARLGMHGNRTINAAVVLNGGTLVQLNSGGTGTWTGPLTINGASTISTTDATWGGGNVTVNGAISGSGSLTTAGTNTVTIGATGSVGSLAGTAQLNLASGVTFTVGSNGGSTAYSGPIAGAGSLFKTGVGTFTLEGNVAVGSQFYIQGGTVNVTGNFSSAGKTIIQGGGTLNWSGTGTIQTAANDYFGVGDNTNGTLNVTAGSLTATPGSNGMFIGTRATGLIHVSGGSFTLGNTTPMRIGGIGAPVGASNGTLTISGDGTVVAVGSASSQIQFGSTAGGIGQLNLNGGALETARTITRLGDSTGTLNFNGGTLRATGNNLNWITNLTSANVKEGGAVIDSGIHSVGIAQPLVRDAGLGAAPDGGLTKVGEGTLHLLSAANTYSGPTNVNAGTLVAVQPGTLGTGTVNLNGGTLLLGMTGVSGFGGDGANWTLNGGATVDADVLTVTTNTTNQARSAFFNGLIPTDGFTVNFTYAAGPGSSNPADGLAVVFQNDSRGPAALGASGGALGYAGTGAITPSAAWGINLYSVATRGIANQVWVNGTQSGGYSMPAGTPAAIDMFGAPVDVELSYDGVTLTAALTQDGNTATRTYAVDLPGMVGPYAHFGFTGGTGGQWAQQVVSGFTYVPNQLPDTTFSNAVAVPDAGMGHVRLAVHPGGSQYAMGELEMGSGATLTVAPSAGSAPDQAYSLTLGATVLSGPATFDVTNNGSGLGRLTLGSVSGPAGASLAKEGPGTLVLPAANTYTGTTTVTGGTLLVNGTHTGGGLYTVRDGGTLGGMGIIAATVSIDAGGAHSPGASVGQQTVGDAVWNPGGAFQFEINNAAGDAGGPSGWDLLTVSDVYGAGTLDISGLTAGSFRIDILSLAGESAGPIADFNPTIPYTWEFVTYDTLLGEFDPGLFVLDASNFMEHNVMGTGHFTILQTETGLAIGFIPEPGTLLMGLIGMAVLLGWRRRR